jgi:hypothetical protein
MAIIQSKSKKLVVKRRHALALTQMAKACKRNRDSISHAEGPQDVLDRVLDAMCAAIDRPGSWERGCFEPIFGADLDYLYLV